MKRRDIAIAGGATVGMLTAGWIVSPKQQRLVDTVTAMERQDHMTMIVDGRAVQNAAGMIQVELTLEQGVITDVALIKNGTTRMESEQINSRAFPILIEEVLEQQTWDVEWVTGASATSEAFITSTKDALSKVGM